jgi:hypothetical protein
VLPDAKREEEWARGDTAIIESVPWVRNKTEYQIVEFERTESTER